MSDNVLKLVQHGQTRGPEAVADLIAWLRDTADDIESGSETAHKAVLTLYEDRGDEFRITSRYCNTSLLERIGIMTAALQDVAQKDRTE